MSEETAHPSEVKNAVTAPEYIVGIGASAGGLNALEQLFDNMPADSGMAFVIIQHLSPDFKSLMDDLLARHTTMPIHRVTNGIELCPNSIYLIPPKTHMTVKDRRLFLTDKPASQHLELPIDIFLHSLAQDAGDRAIAIILSGTGSDGSRGVKAVSSAGGLVIVQSPESAQFDGMPRSAIAANVSDAISSPGRIPHLLMKYLNKPDSFQELYDLEVFEEEGEYAAIFALLRRGYNLDFSKYKAATVERRIRRRMEFRQISGVLEYASIVSGDQSELDLLYRDLLIGVTEFFRDPHVYEFLELQIIPTLFTANGVGEELRTWSAACATGEEAYSLAILLKEAALSNGFKGKITVFATDVHKTSLDFASQGLYDLQRLANVSPDRLERFFKHEGNGLYRVTSDLRKMVVFAPHNLLCDPPFTKLDLVFCRNLLIYLQPEVQDKVISLFHFALKRGSHLVLGSSEGLGKMSQEFDTVANHQKIYRKIRDLKLSLDLDMHHKERSSDGIPLVAITQSSSRLVTLDRQLLSDYDILLHRHMPPGVLINENRQIIHYFGNAFEYLNMPEGRVDNNLMNMVTGNLYIAISAALQRAEKTGQAGVTRNVRVTCSGEEQFIDLAITPLPFEKSLNYHYHLYFDRIRQVEAGIEHPSEETADSSVSFNAERQLRQYTADLEMELLSTRENLQATVEELQTSNEELQATNEEMLAANEELQSTNEELHSVNEELYSVNAEFERKNLELKELNSDHDNLLSSIDVGTVFLDRDLRIRKFNKAVADFFKLLPQDIGRPIDHIAYHLSSHADLLSNIRTVLATGETIEKEEQDNSRWLLHKILPFLGETGKVEGVVLTFSDITKVKDSELQLACMNSELESMVAERSRQLQESENRYRRIFQNNHTVMIIIDPEDGSIVDANQAAVSFYGWEHAELCSMRISDINTLPEHKVREEMTRAKGELRDYFLFPHRLADGSIRDVEVYSGPIELGGRLLLFSIINDVTRRKVAEDELKRSRDEWVSTFDAIPDLIYIIDKESRILRVNQAVCTRFGLPAEELVGRLCHDVMQCTEDQQQSPSCPHKTILQHNTPECRVVAVRRLDSFFDLSASAIHNAAGEHVSSIVIARDVTERNKAQEEQMILEQRLNQAQKLETIGQLAGGIAHDFNNKLMVILGNAEMAGKSNDISAIRHNLKEITRAAEHSRDITMQLLTFSRKQLISPRIVNINTLIINTNKSMTHLVGENISFQYDLDKDLWPIKIDPVQFDQIVVNMAINARDAMPNGGTFRVLTANVSLTAEMCRDTAECMPGDFVKVSFADSGIGMDEETAKHIFEPFFTTKGIGKGTGLGLATIFGIVRQNNGFIETMSTPGAGSIFDIYLPRQIDGEARLNEASHESVRGSGIILLVEDDEPLRNIITQFLESNGYTVYAAAAPSQAMKLLEAECRKLDLVISDVMLPEMSGVTLARHIQEQHPNIGIIFISGYTSEFIKQEMLDNGLDYLQKPVNFSELSKKVSERIGAHRG